MSENENIGETPEVTKEDVEEALSDALNEDNEISIDIAKSTMLGDLMATVVEQLKVMPKPESDQRGFNLEGGGEAIGNEDD